MVRGITLKPYGFTADFLASEKVDESVENVMISSTNSVLGSHH